MEERIPARASRVKYCALCISMIPHLRIIFLSSENKSLTKKKEELIQEQEVV